MIIENGYRKIKYCIVEQIELDANMSDSEIDEFFESIETGRGYMWVDADEDFLDMK